MGTISIAHAKINHDATSKWYASVWTEVYDIASETSTNSGRVYVTSPDGLESIMAKCDIKIREV